MVPIQISKLVALDVWRNLVASKMDNALDVN